MICTFTIGIPIHNPTVDDIGWLTALLQKASCLPFLVRFVVSVHGTDVDLDKIQGDLVDILVCKDKLTFDQNVFKISRAVKTPFWFLLGCQDLLDFRNLERLFVDLRDCSEETSIFVAGAICSELPSHAMPRRLGFLSSYIFRTNFFVECYPHERDLGGWIHTAVFLKALAAGKVLQPLDYELVQEDIEPGFVKPWTANGAYLRYQISLGRLIMSILPDEDIRSRCEQDAVGRWPFDIIKAILLGYRLSLRDRRFVAWWFWKEGGFWPISRRLFSQLWHRFF